MRSTLLLLTAFSTLVLTQTTGKLGDAPIIQNNPAMATYQANLQSGKEVQGTITGVSDINGTGVNFNINFYSFPTTGGPFLYHIHESPVPADGNCTATGAHFDPYLRGESPVCNAIQPETCQLGDLSGKHGSIVITASSTSFQKFYLDLYLSTVPGNEAFFGNRSIVIHDASMARINCANFAQVGGSASSSSSAMSSSGSAATATSGGATSAASSAGASSTSATTKSGAVVQKCLSGGAVVAAFVAFAL